jgi:hypothetical protein
MTILSFVKRNGTAHFHCPLLSMDITYKDPATENTLIIENVFSKTRSYNTLVGYLYI